MYEDRQDVAFAGMKGDSRNDTVETFAAETALPFGAVVTTGTKPSQVKLGGTTVAGVALHSHTVIDRYQPFDAVSVLTRGVVWCAVKGKEAVTERGEVQFDPATGEVSNTAGKVLPNALFRSGAVKTVSYGTVALVELHAPQK